MCYGALNQPLRGQYPEFKDAYEEPVFELPCIRADIWSVTAGNINNVEGVFPDKAIVGLERTFRLNSFEFDFMGHSYTYSFNKDIPAISLVPALTGVSPANIKGVSLVWSAKELTSKESNENTFKFKPEKTGKYDVNVIPNLEFNTNDTLQIGEYPKPVNVFDLDSLIYGRVDPASFTLNLGETKTLTCKVWTDDVTPTPPPAITKGDKITILNGAYELEITDVVWHENAVPAKQYVEASTYEFVADKPGQVNGYAEVKMSISEVLADGRRREVANYTRNLDWKCLVEKVIFKIKVVNSPPDAGPFPIDLELSSLCIKTTFEAIQLDKDGNPLEPLHVNWQLESGDVKDDQLMRNRILDKLNSNVGKIGVFSDENATFSPRIRTPMSIETYLKPPGPSVDLLSIIALDPYAVGYYQSGTIYTRQLEELMSRKRSKNYEDVNVYVVFNLFEYYDLNPLINPIPLDGWTCCKDDIYTRATDSVRIDDVTQSGIALVIKSLNRHPPRDNLAHELGHILIQKGDEHYNGSKENPWPNNNLMTKTGPDNKLEPIQFIDALRFKRLDKNNFLVEE